MREIKKGVGFLLKGAAVMTVFSLLTKLLGVFLRLFLSARIGSEGMGLYQLIMSVYMMFSTFATAGFTVSVSRLVAEKSERSHSDARLLLRNSFAASLCLSLVFTAVMLVFSDFIALTFLSDARCALPLRVLALSMPFMALSACLKGWFIAHSRVAVTSSSSLFEQIAKIAVIALTLNVFMSGTNDIGTLCTGIVLGVTASEMCSFVWLLSADRISRRRDLQKLLRPTETRRDSLRSLVSVTLPISLSVWLTSMLHTAEQLLIPFVFESYSGDRASALSAFGMIRGMVIPILFFPFAFLASLVSVFTPDISRLNMRADKAPRDSRISMILSFSVLFSVAAGGLFFFLPSEIGEAFYRGENTETAIRILALVTPFMYIETISDGLLKAIGEQNRTLRYSIYNSVLRVVFILLIVPRTGDYGYLWLLVVSNTFSFLLCYFRLKKVTLLRIPLFRGWLVPLIYTCASGIAARLVISALSLAPGTLSASVGTAVYLGAFSLLCLLFSFGKIKRLFGRMGVAEEKA